MHLLNLLRKPPTKIAEIAGQDLLALAWGKLPSSPVASCSSGGVEGRGPRAVPALKVEDYSPLANRDHESIKTGAAAAPGNDQEGFEFNENDSPLTSSTTGSLPWRRKLSIDESLLEAASHQRPRKRRKSVNDSNDQQGVDGAFTTTPRKRSTSELMTRKKAALATATEASLDSGKYNTFVSPKRTRFNDGDEDYVDKAWQKGKEVHGSFDTPMNHGARGRGRGRSPRPAKRGRRSGRGGIREKDLEDHPKTKYMFSSRCSPFVHSKRLPHHFFLVFPKGKEA